MRRTTRHLTAIALLGISIAFAAACAPAPSECGMALSPHGDGGLPPSGEFINVPDSLAAGRLRIVNREAAASNGGTAVRVTASQGIGLIWIGGTDFADGTIEADVCGRDVESKSFVGVAFHRKDEQTFEAVYVRPFNFRAGNAERRQHAVQYIAEPDHDYSRLRAKFPEEFEHAVDSSNRADRMDPVTRRRSRWTRAGVRGSRESLSARCARTSYRSPGPSRAVCRQRQ